MRLYVGPKEVPLLKDALRNAIALVHSSKDREYLEGLLDRVELCEALQGNERRAGAKVEEVDR